MKQILFFTVLVLICIRTSAQNKDTTTWYRGGCFSILSGYAKPMSNYGEHEPKDDKDGWALPAINYEVNYAARFCSFASVMLSFKSVTNKFDDRAWVKHMQQSYPEPAYSCTSTTEPWKLRTVYLGIQFCLPTLLVKRLSFTTKLLPGVAFATSIDQNVTVVYNYGYPMPVSSQARLWASKSQAFAYVLGAGFKFAVSDFCSLQLEVDYLSTTPEFEEVVSYSGALRTSYTYNPFKQRMELLNFNLGLGFNFK